MPPSNAAMAGWFAGAVQVVAEQPFDVVKVRLQSRATSFVAEPGALSLARSTFLREGAGAFLQGITPRLLTYSAVKASLFALYERLRAAGAGPPWCAGALAGALNTVVSCPQDVLKSQLQVQIARGAYRGPLVTARALLAAGGVRAFYTGWPPLVLRDTLGCARAAAVRARVCRVARATAARDLRRARHTRHLHAPTSSPARWCAGIRRYSPCFTTARSTRRRVRRRG